MLSAACGGGGFELASPPIDDAPGSDPSGTDASRADASENDVSGDDVSGSEASGSDAHDATGAEVGLDAPTPEAAGAETSSDASSDSNDSNDARSPTFEPSNADLFGRFARTGLLAVVESEITIDTSRGCVSSRALGTCSLATIAGKNEACVCRNDGMTIAGRVRTTGARALVLLVHGSVRLTANGSLSVSASGATDGPGASIGAEYAQRSSAKYPAHGGSFGSLGGGPTPRPVHGTPQLVPLLGGLRGESVGTGPQAGGAGGAIQVSATEEIVVDGFVAANGGGGAGGTAADSNGAGGGSGGAILLEAPRVRLSGTLAANGGGGGATSVFFGSFDRRPGPSGSSGGVGVTPAPGGTSTSCSGAGSNAAGGAGAASDVTSPPGTAGWTCSVSSSGSFSGSGGGVGRIRVNTRSGKLDGTGKVSPPATFGEIP
jgi:hypothetical protein